MDITFVTSLYDLSKLEPNRRSIEYYLQKGNDWKHFPLKVVAFVEPELAKPEYFPSETTLVPIPFMDLPDHALMTPEVVKLIPPHEKDTPNYFVLMSSKFYFLKQAITLNPYKTTYFAWLDYGISHVAVVDKLDSLILGNWSENKVKLANFENYTFFPFRGMEKGYHGHGEARVACGMMVGRKERMLEFSDNFIKQYSEWMAQGIVGLEGWAVSQMVALNPNGFFCYPADYAQIISNFNHVTENVERCLQLSNNYSMLYDYSRAFDFYSCFSRQEEGAVVILTPLTPIQIYRYLVNYFQVAYWQKKELCYILGNTLIELGVVIPEIQKEIENNFNVLEKYFEDVMLPDRPKILIRIKSEVNTLKALADAHKLSESKLVTISMSYVREKDIRGLKCANPRYIQS